MKHKRSLKAGDAQNSGFTLAEMVVVATILLTLALLVMTGMRAYGIRESFRAVVSDVEIHVVETRQRAVAAQGAVGHGVIVASSSVTRFAGPVYNPLAATNEVLVLPNYIVATTSPASAATILFTRRTGVPSTAGAIVLFDTRSSAYATITISAAGSIE
jgi:prepilin-type N-terminal cleavage/methylation domain-containing protein